jgi:hypothetical protein
MHARGRPAMMLSGESRHSVGPTSPSMKMREYGTNTSSNTIVTS